MTKTAVFSAGSWGTAFSIVLADAGNDVTLWARRPEVAEAIDERHENLDYQPGIVLPSSISGTTDVEKALHGADLVVLATPSQTMRDNLAEWAPYAEKDAVFVSLMKGVELGSLKRMSEVIAEVTGAGPDRIAVVSGPNLSPEIARREPAASVVACEDEAVATMIQKRIHSPAFRPYTSVDVLGCEIGGAYKNVVGLAVGMAVGLGFGDNTTASVITRGLAETARLATAQGANPLTLMGLAGLGDLVATCSSPLSRNRTFGERLGQGMTTQEIYATTRQVAEGAKSCKSLLALARQNDVDAPLAEAVDGREDDRRRHDAQLHRSRHQARAALTHCRGSRDVSPWLRTDCHPHVWRGPSRQLRGRGRACSTDTASRSHGSRCCVRCRCSRACQTRCSRASTPTATRSRSTPVGSSRTKGTPPRRPSSLLLVTPRSGSGTRLSGRPRWAR